MTLCRPQVSQEAGPQLKTQARFHTRVMFRGEVCFTRHVRHSNNSCSINYWRPFMAQCNIVKAIDTVLKDFGAFTPFGAHFTIYGSLQRLIYFSSNMGF